MAHADHPDLAARWREALALSAGPIYLRIVDILAGEIRSGRLAPGDALPSQRELAEQLQINFTTVTRAYDEAKKRGLIQARMGQGTFVAGERSEAPAPAATSGLIDLTSALPPNREIGSLVAEQLRLLTQTQGFDFINRAGTIGAADLEAAEAWLRPAFAQDIRGRIAIASGARNALLALLVGSGGTLLVEALVWPTIRTLAGILGIQLAPVAMDDEGLLPEALEEACRSTGAKSLYCVPTSQNPTGAVMSEARRARIADIARRYGLTVIEDDAYGPLQEKPPTLLTNFLPEQTWYVVGLAKLVSLGLRVAYVVAPNREGAQRLNDFLRTTMQAPAPLELMLTTQMIGNGTLPRLIAQVRREVQARQKLAAQVLGETARVPAEAPFAWLTLPASWPRAEYVRRLQQLGVLVTPSDAFLPGNDGAPNAVRIATGATPDQATLRTALERITTLLQQPSHLLRNID